jgi:uncharacterized membrane protein YhaH (DUF805 family)
MDFNTAVKTCFGKYVTFDGRAPRSEYWWFVLFGIILNLVAWAIDALILGKTAEEVGPVHTIVWIVLFLPLWAAAVRRFHDLGWSGWWSAPWVVWDIGITVADLLGYKRDNWISHPLGMVPMALFGLLSIVILVNLCSRGTIGMNKYGPDILSAPEPAPTPAPTAG